MRISSEPRNLRLPKLAARSKKVLNTAQVFWEIQSPVITDEVIGVRELFKTYTKKWLATV